MKFNELGLSEKVLKAVEASGYDTPTPIQEQAIPHALTGRDVLGIAQTGTGKTAAFTLPMLSRLEQGRARARMPRTLILEPTRELAAQVEEAFAKYGVNHKLSLALLIGGVSFGDQEAKITRGADVLIATPGRLLDFVDRDGAKLREEEEPGIGALSGFQNRSGIAFGRAENPPEEKQTQRARSGERKEAEPAIFQGDLNCIEKPESPQPRQRNRGRPCDGILRVQACLSPESLGLNHESRWFRDSPIHECDPFGEAGDLRVAIGRRRCRKLGTEISPAVKAGLIIAMPK